MKTSNRDCTFTARPRRSRIAHSLLIAPAAGYAAAAHASFLSGDTLDTAANVVSWVVLVVVPLIAIVVFWMVHVLPEKIAHKRHHPQVQAIQTLCLLSLVFGGLLWPLAWLWAYTKPTAYRLAYGTDKAGSYHLALADQAAEGKLAPAELAHLRAELEMMRKRGALPPELHELEGRLDALPSRLPVARPVEGTA